MKDVFIFLSWFGFFLVKDTLYIQVIMMIYIIKSREMLPKLKKKKSFVFYKNQIIQLLVFKLRQMNPFT